MKCGSLLASLEDFNLIGFPEYKLPDQQSVTVYPNPTGGRVYIDFAGSAAKNLQVRVYNTPGIQVLYRVMNANPGMIDLSGMGKGIYMIRFAGDSWSDTEKIVLR